MLCGKGRAFSTIEIILIVTQILIVWNHVALCSRLDYSHGFGDYKWAESLKAAEKEAIEKNQPILMVIHKSWCSTCRYLKPKFAASKAIKEQSNHFTMVSLEDNDEPEGHKYAPDGKYYPRILFYSPNGALINIINSHGSREYKYYYSNPDDIADSMKKVINSKDKNYEL